MSSDGHLATWLIRYKPDVTTLREMVSLFLITLLSLRDFGLN